MILRATRAAAFALAMAACAPVSPSAPAPPEPLDSTAAEARIAAACRADRRLRFSSPPARITRVEVHEGLRGVAFASAPRGNRYTCFTGPDGTVVNVIVRRNRLF